MQAQSNQNAQETLPASVEVPGSSLESLAASVGTISINQTLQAQNLRLSVQNGQYVATADIVTKVAGALNGRVFISNVAVGPTTQVPCAAPDSLVVSGSAMIPNL